MAYIKISEDLKKAVVEFYTGGFDKNGRRNRTRFTWKNEKGIKEKDLIIKTIEEEIESIKQSRSEDGELDRRSTFHQIYKNWIETSGVNNLKETTLYHRHNNYRKQVAPYFASTPIGEITRHKIQSYINRMFKEGVPRTSLSLCLTNIRSAFNHAIFLGVIHENPSLNIIIPKKQEEKKQQKKKISAYTLDEAKKIKASLKDYKYLTTPEKLIILFLLKTGMRIGEVLALEWNDIDLDNQTITVNKTRSKLNNKYGNKGYFDTSPKTVASNRTLHLANDLKEDLIKWKKEQSERQKVMGELWGDEGSHIITNKFGRTPHQANLNRKIKRMCEAIDVPKLKLHAFRHTYASLLLAENVEITKISKILGHSSISVTANVYSHFKTNEDEEINNFLDNL